MQVPAVVVPLVHEHAGMLSRQLLYTAVTRAKRLVVLVGQRSALRFAVQRTDHTHRLSSLAYQLRQLQTPAREWADDSCITAEHTARR